MATQTHILWRQPESQIRGDAPCSETVTGTETLYPIQANDISQAVEKCLPRKSLIKLVGDHSGEEIACLRGLLWITQTGNSEDIFVCAGELFTITQAGMILIEGLVETSLKITGLSARSGWRFPARSL